MKVVYITGCLGFIGSYVTQLCLDKGWQVRGIDKITYASNTCLLKLWEKNENFVFEQKDICDIEFLYECDYIINTAAETHVGNSIINSDEFMKSNVLGVHNLLELIRNYRAENKKRPTLIHFSTDEVYGDVAEGESHNESSPLNPSNPYSASKAAADQLILAWARTYNLDYIILRPTNNYGIGQYVEKLIPRSVKLLSLGRRIPLHDEGRPKRIWLHAADTADAVITLINKNVNKDIFNISGDLEQTNLECVTKILKEWNPELANPIQDCCDFSYNREGQDLRYSIYDNKLRSYGWRPRRVFDEELPRIVKFYRDNFIW